MAWQGWSRKSLSLLLIGSLAFNVGVGVTFGVQAYDRFAARERPDDGRPGRGPGRGARGPRGPRGLEMLNLTPEQKVQTDAARESFFEQVSGLRRQVREQHEALTGLMRAAEPDREAIAAQIGEISRLREQMDWRVVEHFLNVKRLLEPAQHEAFNDMIGRAFSRGGPGYGQFGGRRGHHKRMEKGRRGAPYRGDE